MFHSKRGFSASDAVADLIGKKALSNERIGQHLPYLAALRDNAILTRQGDILASVIMRGIDSATNDDHSIDEISESFAAVTKQLGTRFGFTVNKLTVPQELDLPPIGTGSFAQAVDDRWRADLAARALKDRVIMITVSVRPSLVENWSAIRAMFSTGTKDMRADQEARLSLLDEAMNQLAALFVDCERLTVSSGKWLALLSSVLGHSYRKIVAEPGQLLAEVMTGFDVQFSGNQIRLENGMEHRFGMIFGVMTYPSRTWPTMLDALDLPYDITITNSFTPRRANEMVEKIQRVFRQRGASEDAGVSLTEQLVEAADEVASGRAIFGDHHASIQVFCDTEKELETAASEIWRAGQDCGATLVRERWSARPLFFAQCPGNWTYRIRDGIISAQNFGDLAAFHRSANGRPSAQSPWGVNITAFPTVSSGLYRFNFHERGEMKDEPSVGHTLVLGRTGSGKTISTAFLMAQAKRANVRCIVFDKDQGLEMAVRAQDGTYSEIQVGVPTGFNPFATETDDRGAAWLIDWLGAILSRTRPLETSQSIALGEAVRQIVAAPPELRTFDGLLSLLGATDDDGDLVDRVSEWGSQGRYAWLFSKQADRDVQVGEDLLGMDMTELLDQDAERSALLAYMFRRIERVVEDRRPTMIVIDEAWKMLGDDIFVKRLHDWFVTMRKRNCVVMMMTQTPTHLEQSAVGQIIAESVATQLLFPNPTAQPSDYKILRLNAREGEFLSSSTGGLRLALLRSGGDSTVIDTDLSGLGGFVTVLGGGASGDSHAPSGWRAMKDFWKEMEW